MNKLINFFRTAGLYLIGNVLSKLISFFLLPLYTSRLNPSILGEYDFVVTLMSFFAPICFFQIWDAMFRFSFDDSDVESKKCVISNSYLVCIVGVILYSAVFVVLSMVMSFQYVILVFVYGIFVSLSYQYSYLARVFMKNALFSLSGFLNCLVVAVVNIFMIVHLNCGLESLYISSILGMLVQCLVIELKIRSLRFISLKTYNKKMILKMIKFSLPLCIATISYWLLSGLTKFIIVNRLGNFENGLYTVTNKFAMFINLAVTVFQFAWNETAYMSNKDVQRGELYNVAIKYIIQFVFAASCGIMLFSRIIFPFFAVGEEYQGALVYLPITIIGVTFNSIASFAGTIFSTEKETKSIFFTTILAAGINCVLGPVLTKMAGLQGALVALAIAFGILMVARISLLRRAWTIYIGWKSYLALVLMLFTAWFITVCNNILACYVAGIAIIVFFSLMNREIFSIIRKILRKES